jgi:CsbD-like.
VNEVADDRTRGQLDETRGVIKEKVGKVTGDRSTEVSGKLDQAKGKLEKKIGEAKDTIRHQDARNR